MEYVTKIRQYIRKRSYLKYDSEKIRVMCMYVCYWNYGQKSDDSVLEFYASPFMYMVLQLVYETTPELMF